ncbi:hypothetical protein [Dechloromonas sp. HYN0024]|uniref:hypothetical protein n=1 Tax=Dechloromonas sp. HYN0024 TaxID=2231055 RepID=UPI000E4393D8|nr:hypothetical protein [Dechloromonas sp. HYN0024]AXS79109.1 hypothetical protein HYN24_03100 [Dechloromonas sp. HYN0024]
MSIFTNYSNTISLPIDRQKETERNLNSEIIAVRDYLADVISAPADKPLFAEVVGIASSAIQIYGKTLLSPSPTFIVVEKSVAQLAIHLSQNGDISHKKEELEIPMFRRLLPYPGYSLCVSLHQAATANLLLELEATGLAIALALATGKKVEKAFATAIRRSVAPKLFDEKCNDEKSHLAWEGIYRKKRALAAEIFENGSNPNPESSNCERLFDVHARFELSRKMRYSPPRQRQAVLDRRHQSEAQLLESANALLKRAEGGEQTALLELVAFSLGLSLRTSIYIPLASIEISDAWIMALDIDAGLIKTNLDPITPSAATPETKACCFRPANKIIVKPMPAVVANLLRKLKREYPDASTLADLLPDANTYGRQLTLPNSDAALSPSIARMLSTAGPYCVNLGIDRLTAAILVNDYALIPGSKLYYCHVQRNETWAASKTLFAALGWGEPVSFEPGLPFGSRIVPTRDALYDWHTWMVSSVFELNPGRNSSIERLIGFHNAYARLCASIAIFCLAGREVKELRFNTHNLLPEADFSSFNDKWVGAFPGETKVPVNSILKKQLKYWYAHCAALYRRLQKNPVAENRKLIVALEAFHSGRCMPLFFEIDENQEFSPLGTAALTGWWPDELRFSGDLGRHFWETELREAGVWSSRIDLLLRHITHGVESQCSTCGDPLSLAAAAITGAQEKLLTQLGIEASPGLAVK